MARTKQTAQMYTFTRADGTPGQMPVEVAEMYGLLPPRARGILQGEGAVMSGQASAGAARTGTMEGGLSTPQRVDTAAQRGILPGEGAVMSGQSAVGAAAQGAPMDDDAFYAALQQARAQNYGVK